MKTLMRALHPCPHCSRHLRRCERVCPFCGGELPACEAAPAPRAPGRMSRAMLVAAAALGGASCESTAVPLYGAPVVMHPDSGAGGAAGAGGTGGAAADAKDAGGSK
jgi:hypothetical protein